MQGWYAHTHTGTHSPSPLRKGLVKVVVEALKILTYVLIHVQSSR